METNKFSMENKSRWISKIFFNVSESPVAKHTCEEINSFMKAINDFMEARIGDLNWAEHGQNIQQAKDKFVKSVCAVFELYDFNVPMEEIRKGLQNEGQKVKDLVSHLSVVAKF